MQNPDLQIMKNFNDINSGVGSCLSEKSEAAGFVNISMFSIDFERHFSDHNDALSAKRRNFYCEHF